MPRTSPAPDRRHDAREGFALIEMVVALAIIGLVMVLVLPRVAREPGPAALRAKAYTVAGLLRDDRNRALLDRRDVVSRVDLGKRVVVSGADGSYVRIPDSVSIDFLQSDQERAAGGGIRFRADGRSSGGVLTLSRGPVGYRISVNWLTAAVDVLPVATQADR
ncbi:general secretion pathway protein H [Tepidamorphus gemmatus]|uniref:General secretion pathway protein H n=1 Tax=Tepidamorphus gemmatus TaxID=747076 RepID=A0A4R3M0G2_9HYPH|nr:prepilin-type N-terminal cleavage/methylation domain-containing protein [Tepidamorphus gemmatus]TCT06500.1 general secretion pathway protein H [Tepidamorphus gemmatus]